MIDDQERTKIITTAIDDALTDVFREHSFGHVTAWLTMVTLIDTDGFEAAVCFTNKEMTLSAQLGLAAYAETITRAEIAEAWREAE